jgi:hypothetical protein
VIGEGGRGAVRNVDVAIISGTRPIAVGSLNTAAADGAVGVFGVTGAAAAVEVSACRRFSQQGQA